MAIGPKDRISRAGIQRAQAIGFRKSGLRSRFPIRCQPSTTDCPPQWSTQTLAVTEVRVDPGQLVYMQLGTIYGPASTAYMRIWAAEFEDNGAFTDVVNIYGTEFHGLTTTLLTESGIVFTTKSLIPTKVEPFRVYFVGGETLYALFSNRQANSLRFSVEVAINIESMERVGSLATGEI